MPMHPYAHACAYSPYACMVMPMPILMLISLHDPQLACQHGALYPKNLIFFFLIKLSYFVLLHMSCCHLSSMPHHLPLLSPTMPTFCICSPPPFHICFLFLFVTCLFQGRILGNVALSLWKASWTFVHFCRIPTTTSSVVYIYLNMYIYILQFLPIIVMQQSLCWISKSMMRN